MLELLARTVLPGPSMRPCPLPWGSRFETIVRAPRCYATRTSYSRPVPCLYFDQISSDQERHRSRQQFINQISNPRPCRSRDQKSIWKSGRFSSLPAGLVSLGRRGSEAKTRYYSYPPPRCGWLLEPVSDFKTTRDCRRAASNRRSSHSMDNCRCSAGTIMQTQQETSVSTLGQ